MEPVILNLGVIIPETEFMTNLVELCHLYDTLVIMDEVGTAMGRCGRMFGSEVFRIEPDLVTMGKAIKKRRCAAAAVLATDEIAKTVAGQLEFYSTWAWHPLAVEAGIATQRTARSPRCVAM